MPLKVYKRGEIFWMRGTVAGESVRESTGARAEDAARQIAAEREAFLWKCRLAGPENAITFAQGVVIYMEAGGEGRFLEPILKILADRMLGSIRGGHVRDLARHLLPHCGPATWNRQVVTPVSAVINCVAERGLCPPIKIRRFKVDEPFRQAVTREWIDAFCEGATTPYVAAAALFGFTPLARASAKRSSYRPNAWISAMHSPGAKRRKTAHRVSSI